MRREYVAGEESPNLSRSHDEEREQTFKYFVSIYYETRKQLSFQLRVK